MSTAKRQIEFQQHKEDTIQSVKLLYENKYIDMKKAEGGVARQIIGEETTHNLTPKQRNVYEKFIMPHFNNLTYCQNCKKKPILKNKAYRLIQNEPDNFFEKYWCSLICLQTGKSRY